jgi:hypothetical protein
MSIFNYYNSESFDNLKKIFNSDDIYQNLAKLKHHFTLLKRENIITIFYFTKTLCQYLRGRFQKLIQLIQIICCQRRRC